MKNILYYSKKNLSSCLKKSKGFTVAETIVACMVIIIFFFGVMQGREIYYQAILRSTATKLILNVDSAKKAASLSPEDRAMIVFRPTNAPYTSYHISADGETTQSFKLPGGIRVINTSGFIKNHSIMVNSGGDFLSESGEPIRSSSQGILTFISDKTSKIQTIRINPVTDVITLDR